MNRRAFAVLVTVFAHCACWVLVGVALGERFRAPDRVVYIERTDGNRGADSEPVPVVRARGLNRYQFIIYTDHEDGQRYTAMLERGWPTQEVPEGARTIEVTRQVVPDSDDDRSVVLSVPAWYLVGSAHQIVLRGAGADLGTYYGRYAFRLVDEPSEGARKGGCN